MSVKKLVRKSDLDEHDVDLNNLPPFFGQRTLAKLLGVSLGWCERARWEGTGPDYFKIHGAIRYKRDDILDWIDTQKIEKEGESK